MHSASVLDFYQNRTIGTFSKKYEFEKRKKRKKKMTFFAIYEKTKQDRETAMYHVPPLTIYEYLETRTDFLL